MQKLLPSLSASQVCLIPRCSRTSFIRFIMLIICRKYVILQRYKILCNIKRKSVMCYCSVNDVKCIWELVGGDFARAARTIFCGVKTKEAQSYENELSTSGPLRISLIEMPDHVGHDV